MKMKKVLAVLMSLFMVAGVVSYGAPVIAHAITVPAVVIGTDCYSFNEATGVLTLRGTVDRYTLRRFSSDYKELVISVVAEKGTVLPEDSSEMFYNYSNCVSIDLSNADASSVENMRFMFLACSAMTKIDLSGFDTRNVTCMRSMFGYCTGLTSLDVSSFDTGKVTDMLDMFFKCNRLTSLDVSGFDTSSVENMEYMFGECSGLTTLDVSAFDTSKVTIMTSMFEGCTNLTSLDLSGFNTSKVTSMGHMFCRCPNLTSLDLSGFDTSKVTALSCMFDRCTELNSISLGDKFTNISQEAELPNGDGWVNANAPTTVVSGDGKFAVIENNGKNTYKRLPIEEETKITYPANIKVEYSKEYHQVRFTWDKVEGADRYGIAVYLAGKWRVQAQNITETVYTSPKNLTPGKTYKVAIAARVNGEWDITNAIKNAVTVTIK